MIFAISGFLFLNNFMYLFIFAFAGSSLLCWVFVAARAFFLLQRAGATLCAVHGLLIAVAPLAVEHRLQGAWTSAVVVHELSSSGSRALRHRFSSCGAWV